MQNFKKMKIRGPIIFDSQRENSRGKARAYKRLSIIRLQMARDAFAALLQSKISRQTPRSKFRRL